MAISSIINFIGVGQAIFWAVALLGLRRHQVTANRLLATLLLALAAGVVSATLYSTQYITQFPHLAELASPLMFLYPPLIYLYVLASTRTEFSLAKQAGHFVPFLACVFYFMPVYILPRGEKLAMLQTSPGPAVMSTPSLSLLVLLFELFYIVLVLLLLRRHVRLIRNSHSNLSRINLNWLRNLIFALLVVTALAILSEPFAWSIVDESIVPASITVFVFVMGYYGLRQPHVFTGPMNGQQKYQKSGLTEERSQAYLKKLLAIMEAEQPHRDPNLTLKELAARLAISPNHLSQLLNEQLGQSFFDFINSHRVLEFKRELVTPHNSHLKLLAIAYEVGFNSKSAFNSAFKKHVGITPSEYKRTQTLTTQEK
jgi:AraC-like DNA-binding protein